MKTLKLPHLTRSELEESLRIIKNYRNSLKQIGKRSSISPPGKSNETKVVVQHRPEYTESSVREFIQNHIQKSLPSQAQIHYVSVPEIHGGIRVFIDDDLLDLSYNHLSQIIKTQFHI